MGANPMNDFQNDLCSLVREMSLIPALSGHEERMASYFRRAFEPLSDEVAVDTLGNVIATLNGTDAKAPRVMVFAHMDQLGFVVRKIEAEGFIRFERLGGIPEKVLPATRVLVEGEEGTLTQGLIGTKAHHVTPSDEKYTVTPYTGLYVDIGASSRDQVTALGIEVGCPITYEPCFTQHLGSRISATSIDDRAGCAVLIKLAEYVRKCAIKATLYLVGSVQEEFNLRGAAVAAAQIKPDLAISLDLVVSGDTPDMERRTDLALGGGAVLGLYSFHGRGTLNGTIPHPALVRLFREVARSEGIPLQRSANLGLLTDSSYVQLTGTGIPCIDLGFPARYTHTPVETCDLADLEGLYTLLVAGLSSISPDFDLSRRGRTS